MLFDVSLSFSSFSESSEFDDDDDEGGNMSFGIPFTLFDSSSLVVNSLGQTP